MCLAVPGRILAVDHRDGSLYAQVEFGGIVRETCLDLVREAQPGDYVLVHVGYALSRVDSDEAERAFRLLEELGLLEAEGLGATASREEGS